MPTYVWLLEFTREGIESIEDVPRRDESGIEMLEGMGIEVRGHYYTLGQYDEVLVFTAPDDETATRAALRIGREGNVSTETLRAFEEGEFHDLVAGIAD